MLSQSDGSKNSALQMVGRTVVNFQRLEHNLKLAARLGPVQGTVHKIQRDIERRNERASTLTLGQAIQAWLAYCDGQESTHLGTPDLFDVSIQMTFTLESDTESASRHAQALSELLEQRNHLIHSRLARFDWSSHEACDGLVAELEGVNASIAEQIEYTSSLLKEIAELHKEHAEALSAALANGKSAAAAAMPNTSLERTRGR